jgi:transposase-like protein
VWLYCGFGVSPRDVSELMLARGIEVSYEALPFATKVRCKPVDVSAQGD